MQQQLGNKMFKNGKAALIVAVTLGVLGTASAAFAGGMKNDDGAGQDRSEGKVGPSGQVFSSGQVERGWPNNAFAQSRARTHLDRRHRKIMRDLLQLRKQRGSSTVGSTECPIVKYAEDKTVDYVINCPGLGL
jgi:hypothetical protein